MIKLQEKMAQVINAPIDLRANFEDVRNRISLRAAQCNRSVDDITLIAVSKTHPVATLRAALEAGATDLGENRVQEAEPKILEIGREGTRWHLIGHLQANKALRAVKLFDLIHSVDSAELAQRLDRLCKEEDRANLPILIQVDLAGEETKSGVSEKGLNELIQVVKESDTLSLKGLMVLPPFLEDLEKVRPYFRRLRELRDELRAKDCFGDGRGELSMGMTHDFEVAIEEGATMLRIGTALFGERQTRT
ncbi:MAG TPA: YggS family pyridoxal phosphate-dependent enzyme [Pyrinomonadaceae bacterium]|nr:YggS family pyridoxal phosphate-dependent enzyme [Pyrinomonadaceae bacterium]